MKVLLKQDVKNIGRKGEIVEVKEGYGRNFLIPNALAIEASQGAMRQVEEAKKAQERRRDREKIEAQETANSIAAMVLTIKHKSGDEGHLFGSVTNSEIAEALKKRGFEVDKKKIHLEEPIRHLGKHEATLKLHPEVTATISVTVEKQA
jgi:large subunit ribosomal protein L9